MVRDLLDFIWVELVFSGRIMSTIPMDSGDRTSRMSFAGRIMSGVLDDLMLAVRAYAPGMDGRDWRWRRLWLFLGFLRLFFRDFLFFRHSPSSLRENIAASNQLQA